MAATSVAHMVEDTNAVVESGQPVICHGDAKLGELSFVCDGTIAGQIWGAGAALGRHLLLSGLPERPDVVEIGSGTGVAGIAAAAAGAKRVVLTDLPDEVARLNNMIQHNSNAIDGADASAAALPWGDEAAANAINGDEGFDLILAADVLYTDTPEVHANLRASLIHLARPRDGRILHAYEERWPKIIKQWQEGLERCPQLKLVGTSVLPSPPSIRDGRRLVLEEYALTEEGLFGG